VHLPADPQLQRADGGEQGGIGAGRDPELEGGGEDRGGEVVGEHLEHGTGPSRPGRQGRGGGGQLGPAHLGQVLDRGHDEVVLGREVVQLGAPAHPGPLRDQRGRRTAEPALDQALDRGLEQPGPHEAGPLLLGHADRPRLARHPASIARRATNSQA
jgi:hypothetical protein